MICFVSSENEILQPQQTISSNADENGVIFHFNSTSFDTSSDNNKNKMYFKVKALEGNYNDDHANYSYIDSIDEDPGEQYNTLFRDGEIETDENGAKYRIKYFTIEKKSDEIGGHIGNLLYIFINIKPGKVDLTNTMKDGSSKQTSAPSGLENTILQKSKPIKVDANDYMIAFNSKDFDVGEEMHFKIKALEGTFLWSGINYQFISSTVGYSEPDLEYAQFSLKTTYETTPSGLRYQTKYFNIVKDKNKFRGTDGSLLLIYFMIDYGEVEITNTEEDEGKFETWKIVVIVVVIAVAIIISIIIFCIRRKRQLNAMQMNNPAMYPSNNVVVSQPVPYQQQYY
jgi:hypothetical protein